MREDQRRFQARFLKESGFSFDPAGLKVVLDICDVNVAGDADEPYNRSTSVHTFLCSLEQVAFKLPPAPAFLKRANVFLQHALQFWLELGVAGFAICDTDAAYSEEVKLCLLICILTLFAKPPHKVCPSQTLLEWRSLLKKFSDEEERWRSLSETL